MALSTVHYHLKSLCKVGIVDDTSFHYSEKGKEVIHYSLHDKAIIILPRKKRSSPSLKKQLQTIVPGILTSTIIATGAFFYSGLFGSKEIASSARDNMMTASDATIKTATASTQQQAQETIMQQLSGSAEFLLGVLFTIIIIILSLYIKRLIRHVRTRG